MKFIRKTLVRIFVFLFFSSSTYYQKQYDLIQISHSNEVARRSLTASALYQCVCSIYNYQLSEKIRTMKKFSLQFFQWKSQSIERIHGGGGAKRMKFPYNSYLYFEEVLMVLFSSMVFEDFHNPSVHQRKKWN